MPLNLAPLSRSGGYPMTRLDTWQRYRARCVTAPLWKNVCNGTSVAKGWLWCCLLPSYLGFGYHTHCALVITHNPEMKSNQTRSNYCKPYSTAAWTRSKKVLYWWKLLKGMGLSIITLYSFCLLFFPPHPLSSPSLCVCFSHVPTPPLSRVKSPTIPALLSCPPPYSTTTTALRLTRPKVLRRCPQGGRAGLKHLALFLVSIQTQCDSESHCWQDEQSLLGEFIWGGTIRD